MGCVHTYYSAKVIDKKGNIVKEIKRRKCNSYLKNFMLLLNATFRKTSNDVVDTTGSVVAGGAKGSCWAQVRYTVGYSYTKSSSCTLYGGLLVGAGEGDDTYGIVVGSGTDPVSPEDYNLASKIAHGTADGQLYYYGTDVPTPSVSGNTITQSLSRQFVNLGTVGVIINEIGLVVKIPVDNYTVLVIRDVLSEPISVAPGDTIVIQIDIEVTV